MHGICSRQPSLSISRSSTWCSQHILVSSALTAAEGLLIAVLATMYTVVLSFFSAFLFNLLPEAVFACPQNALLGSFWLACLTSGFLWLQVQSDALLLLPWWLGNPGMCGYLMGYDRLVINFKLASTCV